MAALATTPTPAAEGSIRHQAPHDTTHRAADLGDREELRRPHRGDVERVLRVEHQVGEERRLGDREREPADEDDENGRAPEELAELGEARQLDGTGGRACRLPAIEQRDEPGGHEREDSGRGERVPPAPRPSDRRQEQRRRQPAQGEARLLHAHRDPALPRRKPLHHGTSGRGIQHAEAKAAEHQQDQQQAVIRTPRREGDHGADQELAERERQADAQPIGEPARGQRHQDAAQVDRGQEESDLHAREPQRVEEKRRERRDRQRGERAESVRHRHQRQDRPSGLHGIGIVPLRCRVFRLG